MFLLQLRVLTVDGETGLWLSVTTDDAWIANTFSTFDPGADRPTVVATWLWDSDTGLRLVSKIQPLWHTSVSHYHLTNLK